MNSSCFRIQSNFPYNNVIIKTNKFEEPLLTCGSQMILSIDFDVMFSPKCPTYAYFLFSSLLWLVPCRYYSKSKAAGILRANPSSTHMHLVITEVSLIHIWLVPFRYYSKSKAVGILRANPSPTNPHASRNNRGIPHSHFDFTFKDTTYVGYNKPPSKVKGDNSKREMRKIIE